MVDFRQGDIVWLDFNPQTGREQAGRRPALIVSKTAFTKLTGLATLCPITNTDNNFPLHVAIPPHGKTTGFILCEQQKTLDIIGRNAVYKDTLDDETLCTVLDILQGIIAHD